MKKIIYLLILNSVTLFFSLNTQATSCEGGFVKRLKQSVFGRRQQPLSLEASREALLKELKEDDVFIQSVVRPSTAYMQSYGNGFLPPAQYILQTKGLVKYSAFHVPEKGHFFLSVSITLNAETRHTYDHWIHWPSQAKEAQLSEHTVREIFNKIYEAVYGRTLEWMITNLVFSKTMDHIEKNQLNQFDVHDLFNFNALFFKTQEQQSKSIIIEVIGETTGEQPHQTRSTPEEQPSIHIPPAKMIPRLRRIILHSYSIEQLNTLPPAEIRKLPIQDIVDMFNSPEKIKTLDMSSLSPKTQISLLTEHALWRDSITPEQVRQLDTSIDGIQHVLVPTAKYYVWRPAEELARIGIDTLTDAQIEKMDRDTFLRDIFLAGELFVNGIAPVKSAMFMTERKQEVYEHGHDAIMQRSLPKQMHDFIVQWLGFETNFESMTMEQKRELFKAETAMMIKTNQQFKLLETVIEENERGNHNWFSH